MISCTCNNKKNHIIHIHFVEYSRLFTYQLHLLANFILHFFLYFVWSISSGKSSFINLEIFLHLQTYSILFSFCFSLSSFSSSSLFTYFGNNKNTYSDDRMIFLFHSSFTLFSSCFTLYAFLIFIHQI
jgi:hypothetical protein